MAKFRVLQTSFIGDHLRQPGDVVEIEFEKGVAHGDNLEPIKEAKAKKGADAGTDAGADEGSDLV